ncbi:MAG: hypothetical protein AAB152_18180 [Candidatus Coatesbacteria bacterium]
MRKGSVGAAAILALALGGPLAAAPLRAPKPHAVPSSVESFVKSLVDLGQTLSSQEFIEVVEIDDKWADRPTLSKAMTVRVSFSRAQGRVRRETISSTGFQEAKVKRKDHPRGTALSYVVSAQATVVITKSFPV